MFNFDAVFQSVLASLQDSFATVIVNFITSLFSGIVPGLLGG